MSNIIPPLLCDSPPPLDIDDDEDDFGDFTTAGDLSYPGEVLSLPGSPHRAVRTTLNDTLSNPNDYFSSISPLNDDDEAVEPNCDASEIKMCNGHSELIDPNDSINRNVDKDHQDKRKCDTPEIILNADERLTIRQSVDASDDVEESSVEEQAVSVETVDAEQESCDSKSLSLDVDERDQDAVDTNSVDDANDTPPGDDGPLDEVSEQSVEIDEDYRISSSPDFDDFITADFASETVPQDALVDDDCIVAETITRDAQVIDEVECTFEANFDDFQMAESTNDTPLEQSEFSVPNDEDYDDDDDDFGDFDDYSTQTQISTPFVLDAKDSTIKAEKIITDLFPATTKDAAEYEDVDFVTNNSIFKGVKDIELTNALSYQWSSSESQKMLLRSLNIDTRNILYGQPWNSSMPRFAANLSSAPLEPIKSDVVPPSTNTTVMPTTISNVPESTSCEVPDAQFDWTGSGLINPLDSLPPEEEQSSSTAKSVQPDSSEEVSPTISSLSSRQNDLESFTQSQPSTFSFPTLQGGDNESVKSLKFTEVIQNDTEAKDNDQGFDEFTSYKSADESQFSTWSSTVSLRETHISNCSAPPPVEAKAAVEDAKDDVNDFDEDDFTAFQSVPVVAKVAAPILPTVSLELLKPTVLASAPTKIEWPEPGISSDDITNLELSLVTLNTTSSPGINAVATKPVAPPQQITETKKLKADEDDWSDFVSNQDIVANGVHKNNNKSELPLSVAHMQQFTVAKPPAPSKYKTFENVAQPPLKSNNSLAATSQHNSSSTTLPFDPLEAFNKIHQQPSSNKYEAPPTPSKIEQESDEDWSEFVSSPVPLSTAANGWMVGNKPQASGRMDWNKPPQFTSWSANVTPNIITNPVHFDLLPNYSQAGASTATDMFKLKGIVGKKQQTMPIGSSKNSIPSISAMPDLDFIAPRNRTFPKK